MMLWDCTAGNSRINWQVGRDMEGSRRGHGLIQAPSQHFPGTTQKIQLFSSPGYGMDNLRFKSRLWPYFCLLQTPRPSLGLIQPHNWWTPVFFPKGPSGWGVKLITCLHLVLRFKNEWSSTSSTLYVIVMCTGTSSPFYLSRFAVVWLRYEPWILNTNIEHYCCVSLFGKMWSCEHGGRMRGCNWSKQRIIWIVKLLVCNTRFDSTVPVLAVCTWWLTWLPWLLFFSGCVRSIWLCYCSHQIVIWHTLLCFVFKEVTPLAATPVWSCHIEAGLRILLAGMQTPDTLIHICWQISLRLRPFRMLVNFLVC